MENDCPYEVDGDTVRYRCRTQWERKTLMTNGFKVEDIADSMVLVDDRPGAEYVARTVRQGGVG